MSPSSESRSSSIGRTCGLKVLHSVLESLRTVDPEMPTLAASIFVEIAMSAAPYDMVDLRRAYSVADSTISRNVAYLARHLPKGDKRHGLGLIELEENPEDRRLKVLKLTRRGRILADDLDRIMVS